MAIRWASNSHALSVRTTGKLAKFDGHHARSAPPEPQPTRTLQSEGLAQAWDGVWVRPRCGWGRAGRRARRRGAGLEGAEAVREEQETGWQLSKEHEELIAVP